MFVTVHEKGNRRSIYDGIVKVVKKDKRLYLSTEDNYKMGFPLVNVVKIEIACDPDETEEDFTITKT